MSHTITIVVIMIVITILYIITVRMNEMWCVELRMNRRKEILLIYANGEITNTNDGVTFTCAEPVVA